MKLNQTLTISALVISAVLGLIGGSRCESSLAVMHFPSTYVDAQIMNLGGEEVLYVLVATGEHGRVFLCK